MAHPELADSLETERELAPQNVRAKFFQFHIIKTIFSRKKLHKKDNFPPASYVEGPLFLIFNVEIIVDRDLRILPRVLLPIIF